MPGVEGRFRLHSAREPNAALLTLGTSTAAAHSDQDARDQLQTKRELRARNSGTHATESTAPGSSAVGGDKSLGWIPSGDVLALMRLALGVTINVLALLIVLSELGGNIGPLLARAWIFGLAIPFGS